ncbi:beta-defensin 115 [Artibeus jamaicensis]|uniref:beta-defensin 115 n=1 Tax=Artibeus jamaicensis TaxID=9417 RepID=UPI00235B29B8|nr:beta-defensin 115 [Artibeus jamaicensis]
MLLDLSSPPSGYVKFLLLALAVLVVLPQASPDGWVHRCDYSTGQCRTACKENEKEKEKCIGKKICCIPLIKPKSSSVLKKQEMIRGIHDTKFPVGFHESRPPANPSIHSTRFPHIETPCSP